MFNFFKKTKKINTLEIKEFNSAIKAVEVYIALYDWEKAKNAIEEILKKEEEALNYIINKIKSDDSIVEKDSIIEKEKSDFINKREKVEKIKNKLELLEIKYIEKENKERFKIRFKKIKEEINWLIGTKNYQQAMWLLQSFLEENKWNDVVMTFFNKEKKIIQNDIERQRKKEKDKIHSDTKFEALELIWDTTAIKTEIEKVEKEKNWLFQSLSNKLNFYKNLKEKIKNKKLLDEINMLIEEDNRLKTEIAEKKLENIHKWLIKEITKNDLIWYELYWKILWADKISWDTFWIEENKNSYKFFIWDATGHWVRAWFIITLISKLFKDNSWKDLKELVFNTNNALKQDLESRNFITWVFFEIDKSSNNISYVWMWHEPLLVYKKSTGIVERIIPGWLASWIRIIKDKNDIKVKELAVEDGDILLIYSDWLIENKSIDWDYYGINKLQENFQTIANSETDVKKIYEWLINDVKLFRGWSKFDDDITTIVLKRDSKKDIVNENDKYIEDLRFKEKLNKSEVKNLKWKNKEEISKELEKIRRQKEIKWIVKNLEILYMTWEILKVKEEATRYIKAWYIDEKINYYLRKVINNEKKYKIDIKDQKMQLKYNVLTELFKKWDYDTIIKEVEEIIAKDWNI